jgi:hypothetical protein
MSSATVYAYPSATSRVPCPTTIGFRKPPSVASTASAIESWRRARTAAVALIPVSKPNATTPGSMWYSSNDAQMVR